MESLISLLFFAATTFLVVKLVTSASRSGAQRKARLLRMREGGLEPDYIFEGRYYMNLNHAAYEGGRGDGGWKFALALYKKQRFIRVFIAMDKTDVDYDIQFDDIMDVRMERHPAGVYGDSSICVAVIETSSEIPLLSRIVAGSIGIELNSKLRSALRETAMNNSRRS